MSPIRIGTIGCGGIAGVHLSALSKRPGEVSLAGFADVRLEAAKAAAEKYGCSRYTTNYSDLLSDDIDAVLVCVPTPFHADIAAAALRAGKSVFCEKPLARTHEQGDAMLRAVRESGERLQIGFVRRFDDEWLAFREVVQAGKIGRPAVWHDVQSGPGPSAAWYTQDEIGGGPFLDGCIHNIDFALYTFGPAEWAFAHARTYRKSDALDTGTATVRFQSGDELLLAWSWGLPAGCHGGRVFEILGPDGLITWGAAAENPAERAFSVRRDGDTEVVRYPANALSVAYELQMEEFIRVARRECEPRAGVTAGLDSLRVALAILESGRTAQRVDV